MASRCPWWWLLSSSKHVWYFPPSPFGDQLTISFVQTAPLWKVFMGSECPLHCFLVCLFVKFFFFFFPLLKCHFLMITSVLCFWARVNCCHLCLTTASGILSFQLVFNLITYFCVYPNGILTMIMGRGSIKKHYESQFSLLSWVRIPKVTRGFHFFCPL